jgi:hypothetical protein
MTTPVFDNSSRARCGTHMRDTAIRIYSAPRLIWKNTFVKVSSPDKVVPWALQNIFAGLFNGRFPKYGRILDITNHVWWRPQAAAWQACPWEHRPSSSAPCAVPTGLFRISVNTSRISLVRNNKRYLAFSPAVLELLSRCPLRVINFYLDTFSTRALLLVLNLALITAVYCVYI